MRLGVFTAVLLAWASVTSAEPAWKAPRTPDGRPSLEGVWTNASVTRLTRPPGQTKLVISAAEAKAVVESDPLTAAVVADAAAKTGTDPNAPAPPVGGDPQGASVFWADPGRTLAVVKGQYRTSWIVDPADGRLPFSPAGQALRAKAAAFAAAAGAPADPETLQPWDRCIISSRGSGGPGMLNNIYNSNYQILQTPTAVAIEVEMIHEVRTIPVFPDRATALAAHEPAVIQPWLGDSVGWWEGDTLVVDTTHVNPEQGRAGPIYLTPQARVTERFTRVAQGEIFYAFTVDDPAYYAKPWTAEMTLSANPARLFEYACHEGNYALPAILRGARRAEAGALNSAGSRREPGG